MSRFNPQRDAGSRMLHDAYTKRRTDFRLIRAQEQGLKRIGHCGFFKSQSQPALWPLVTDWLDTQHDTRKAA